MGIHWGRPGWVENHNGLRMHLEFLFRQLVIQKFLFLEIAKTIQRLTAEDTSLSISGFQSTRVGIRM